jgi:hypothetical protein
MAIGTGLLVMTGAFVLVWPFVVICAETTIVRDVRESEVDEHRV